MIISTRTQGNTAHAMKAKWTSLKMDISKVKRLSKVIACLCLVSLLPAHAVNAATYLFHNDHLGTPQVLTDATQQVVWQSAQDPFGEVTEVTNQVEQNLRFPGQYFDLETGLSYNYFRSYDSSTGRYTQSDPIGLDGGTNTYGYALANPIRYSDSYGLKVYSCGIEGTAIAAIIGGKLKGGVYFDDETGDWGLFSDLPSSPVGTAAGVEFGLVFTADITANMDVFLGDTIETGMSGFAGFGLDAAIVPGAGFVSGGIDIGPSYGLSAARYDTSTYSIPEAYAKVMDIVRGGFSEFYDKVSSCGC